MNRLRVAAIRYINSLPLIYGLERNPSIELLTDTPSSCFQLLQSSDVDVALIPIIATQLSDNIRAVKGLGIAATEKTESVYLFTTKPLDKLRAIVADPASLTSVILARIILKHRYRNEPEVVSSGSFHLDEALRQFDAALLIGDDAITADKSEYDYYDLAAEWHLMTGSSFIFAVWGSRRSLNDQEISILQESLEDGMRHWKEIYERAARMLPIAPEFLKRYYNLNLHYQLTRSDYEGLLQFLNFAAQYHFLERIRKDIWL